MHMKFLKFSKFLKDIFITGFAQVGVLLLGLLFTRIMGTLLDTDSFGLYTLVRRWTATLLPLLTLSLGLSLTKFVSFDKEKQGHYFKISIGFVHIVFIAVTAIAFIIPGPIAQWIFSSPNYTLLTKIFPFFLYAGSIHLLIFSYYRGRQEMGLANGINLAYFSFPVLLGGVLLVFLGKNGSYKPLLYYYGIYSALVPLVFWFYLVKKKYFAVTYPFRFKFKEISGFLGYGLNRMPASFFLSGIFLLPAFWASQVLSLEATGFIGLGVMVLRLMEIFSDPFNKIFLPKFSELVGENRTGEIKEKCMIVLDFIITFTPVLVITLYGLSKYIVIFWMGDKYAAAIPAVKISILFSAFYIAYAVLRGILNGLYTFPYVNVVCVVGLAAAALPITTFYNENVTQLAVGFGMGLLGMGVSSLYILMRKLKRVPPLKTVLLYSMITIVIGLFLYFADAFVLKSVTVNIYFECAILLSYRLLVVGAVFFFLWRRSLWFRELGKRMNVKHG